MANTDLTQRIFSAKRADSLRPQQVKIKEVFRDWTDPGDGSGGSANYTPNEFQIEKFGEPMNFFNMLALRKQGADPEKIKADLNSADGHVFANLGVSVQAVMQYKGQDYAVLVRHTRSEGDFNDTVTKFVSGYIYAEDILQPWCVAEEEIAEEFLVFTKDGKLLPGKRQGRSLPRLEKNVKYDSRTEYKLTPGTPMLIPGVPNMPLTVVGGFVDSFAARLYFHAPTNSAQLFYPFRIEMPEGYLEDNQATMHHSEAVFNKETGMLEVKLRDRGLFLAKLDRNKLTGEMYTFEEGKLVPYQGKVTLSEAFAPKDEGILTVNNIGLEQFLQNQR